MKKAAAFLKLLVGQGGNAAVDSNLPTVDRQGLKMEIFAANDQHPLRGVQNNGVFIKAFYFLNAGN